MTNELLLALKFEYVLPKNFTGRKIAELKA